MPQVAILTTESNHFAPWLWSILGQKCGGKMEKNCREKREIVVKMANFESKLGEGFRAFNQKSRLWLLKMTILGAFSSFFLSSPIRIDCTHLFVLWWKSVRKFPRYEILGGLLFWIVARPLNSREACRQKGVNSNLSSLFSPFLFVWRRKVLDGDWTVCHHGGTGHFCRECERGMLRGWDRGKQ